MSQSLMTRRTSGDWTKAVGCISVHAMTDMLYIGDYAYSSWSLRGWLLYRRFGISCSVRRVDFHAAEVRDQLTEIAPARTVPSVKFSDGGLVWDSLALAEELASRHPGAGLWPADPVLRTTARSLAAEMHSGFGTLRGACPMNTRTSYADVPVPDALQSDLTRIEEIWDFALSQSGGPWLCGDYSAADAFYAPVAARIAGYSLPMGQTARAYVERHLADSAFRRFRAMGLVSGVTLPWYEQEYPKINWPGPAPRAARAVDTGPSVNAACPYSGDPVTHFMEMEGRIWGFCNAFCRDKTVADPEAWPEFMALVGGH